MSRYLETWENYKRNADDRGWMVATILSQLTLIEGKKVLDFGCGEGGTSRSLCRLGAKVTAVDMRSDLACLFKDANITFIDAREEESYFNSFGYDIVILQDVLEHLPDPEYTLRQVKNCLGPGGLVFISTPNRFSLLNIITDPHWNLPMVGLFSRKFVAFFVQKIFRRDRRQRTDWAALLSLNKLKKLMAAPKFDFNFVNNQVAKILFQRPQSVVCHPGHLLLIHWIGKKRLDRWARKLVNDRMGIFNFFINPTWYVIAKAR